YKRPPAPALLQSGCLRAVQERVAVPSLPVRAPITVWDLCVRSRSCDH
ncbi:unnamed protein product, partial [Staurois parvus]